MTDREKLIELINHVDEGHVVNLMQPGGAEALADYLLANGVRVLPILHGDTLPTTREQALERLGLKNADENVGEWIPVELIRSFGSFAGIRCSLCGFEKIKSSLLKAPNYCENCGAKMKIMLEENN